MHDSSMVGSGTADSIQAAAQAPTAKTSFSVVSTNIILNVIALSKTHEIYHHFPTTIAAIIIATIKATASDCKIASINPEVISNADKTLAQLFSLFCLYV